MSKEIHLEDVLYKVEWLWATQDEFREDIVRFIELNEKIYNRHPTWAELFRLEESIMATVSPGLPKHEAHIASWKEEIMKEEERVTAHLKVLC